MTTNRKTKFYRKSALFIAFATSASAQLSWDPVDSNWDLTTDNWDDGTGTFVVWDNSGDQEAIFPIGASENSLDIVNGGVTVGDLTTSIHLTLQSVTDNLGLISIRAGGATWNTGGTEISFVNDQANDTPLSLAMADTLTITGGGDFDTGEKANDSNWTVAGATLDVTDATIVRGHTATIGQFGTVKLVGDSTFVHERNASQTYANNWELGPGVVTFENRWDRQSLHSGIVSGTGTLRILNYGGLFVRLMNTANTFSGGIIVDSTASRSELLVVGDDAVMGAVPATFDPDNILLLNGGELKANGVDINSLRGITLDGGGVIVNSGSPNTYGGTITGTGGLQIGREEGGDANGLILTSDTHDYLGETLIHQGRLNLGIDEALPDNTVLTIGGKNSSLFVLNGFTQTLSGLATASNNTRQIINYDAATSPSIPTVAGNVILDIADDVAVAEEFSFVSAFGVSEADDRGNLNLTKNGDGAIGLDNVRIAGTVDVNAGALRIGNSLGISVVGDLTNNSVLVVDEASTAASFTAGAGSSSTFNWEVSDWTGAAGTGFTQLAVTGDITLDATSSFTIVVEEVALANFTESNVSFVVASVGGITNPSTAAITVDASGFTSGTGSWDVRLDGNDIVLDYTAGASSPYTAWAAGFASLTGGFNDDDDNDGIANGLEYYFFNSDPTFASNLQSPLCVKSAAGSGNIVFSHDRPVDDSDITATYEWSTTLDGDWTASGVANGGTTITITPGTPTPAATNYETVEVTTTSTPATLDKIFVRLSVSMP